MLRVLLSDDLPRSRWLSLALLAILVGLALAPFLFPGAKSLNVAAKICVFIVLAASFDLLLGYTGIVSFAHTMFFGIGAYAAVLLSPSSDAASLAWLLPASVMCAALYALAVGALSLRTKGVYFIMVTLAFAQMAYYVVHDTPLGGGTDGIYLNVKPVVGAWSSTRWRWRTASTSPAWCTLCPGCVSACPGRTHRTRTSSAACWQRRR